MHCKPQAQYSCTFYLTQVIGQNVVSLLNGDGGIIAFGLRQNGVIYGEKISRSEEDKLQCLVDSAVKRIQPCVRVKQCRIHYIPVHDPIGNENQDRKVLEIKVESGKTLYEDRNHEVREIK